MYALRGESATYLSGRDPKARSRKLMVEIEKERFKKLFPNLAQTLEGEEMKIEIASVGSEDNKEKTSARKFVGYTPNVIDFIRRCETRHEAEKIIIYLEKKGEISSKYAEKLKLQIKKKGIRSFGPKKGEDYYLKHGGIVADNSSMSRSPSRFKVD
jgi:hypothetical protein